MSKKKELKGRTAWHLEERIPWQLKLLFIVFIIVFTMIVSWLFH